MLTGSGRGDEGRDGDAVRLHGSHGDHPPERGGDPELLRQIRTDHLRRVYGSRPCSYRLEVRYSLKNTIFKYLKVRYSTVRYGTVQARPQSPPFRA
jgi:hypothetical protein